LAPGSGERPSCCRVPRSCRSRRPLARTLWWGRYLAPSPRPCGLCRAASSGPLARASAASTMPSSPAACGRHTPGACVVAFGPGGGGHLPVAAGAGRCGELHGRHTRSRAAPECTISNSSSCSSLLLAIAALQCA
jgi:hypothetical protein